MLRADFHYELPEELIARHPTARRRDSRLLHLDGASGAIADRQFADLPGLLRRGDLLVFNDTRVVPARLLGTKDNGRPRRAAARAGARRRPRAGAAALEQASRRGFARSGFPAARPRPSWVGRTSSGLLDFAEASGRRIRALRRDAAAAVHEACGGGLRPRALPDRLCARAGRGGRADRRPALRRGPARRLPRCRARQRVRHAARRRRYVPAGPGRRRQRASHARRARQRPGSKSARPCAHAGNVAAAWWRSAPRPCARSSRRPRQAVSMHTPGIHGSSSPPDSSSGSWTRS